MGKTFHVVHSIKGGCGKTAFSLFKSLEFAAEIAKSAGRADDKAHVLLLDADFKGTGLQVLVYTKDKETFCKNEDIRLGQIEEEGKGLGVNPSQNYFLFRKDYQHNSLNDFLSGKCSALSEIVTESGVVVKKAGMILDKVENVEAFNGYPDFVFCSSELQERKRFGYQGKNQPALSVGRFRVKMKTLLREICDREQYQDVVIDMPAGYDEYSDVVIEVLRDFCREESKGKIFYYTVSTADRSHLDAMREDVFKAVETDPVYGNYDRIYVVFSENREGEFEDAAVQKYMDEINRKTGAKVAFIKNCFQKEYYEFCREKPRENFPYQLLPLEV